MHAMCGPRAPQHYRPDCAGPSPHRRALTRGAPLPHRLCVLRLGRDAYQARFEAIAKRLEKRPDVATSLKSLAHTWRVSEAGSLGDINAPANGDSSGSDAPFEWATIPNTPQ